MTLPQQRFLPLDIFRGMTICFMIIVNTGGGPVSYWPLEHAAFNGFTPTDLVFPSFLFAVGNAMSFSMRKYEEMGNAAFLTKVIRRTLLIFLIGYLMYWFPFFHQVDGHWVFKPISHTRIFGVLQRIALCYGIAALMIHYLPRKAVWGLAVLFLLGYWWLAWYFGTPGAQYTLKGNADLRLDHLILGSSHMYHGESVNGVPYAFDPEGILSTIPAIVNVIAGYYTGLFVQKKGKDGMGVLTLINIGAILVLVALAWNIVFPINKKIWTSSFVLCTVGLDLILLGELIYLIDLLKWKGWTSFFNTFGKNALPIYILSEILIVTLLMIPAGDDDVAGWTNTHFFQAYMPGPFGSLMFAVTYMLICWLVGKWLEWRKIYIKV